MSLNPEIVRNTMKTWWCLELSVTEVCYLWDGVLGVSQPALGMQTARKHSRVVPVLLEWEVSLLTFAQTQKSAFVSLEHPWLQKGQKHSAYLFPSHIFLSWSSLPQPFGTAAVSSWVFVQHFTQWCVLVLEANFRRKHIGMTISSKEKRASITPFSSANERNWYQRVKVRKKNCLLAHKKGDGGRGSAHKTRKRIEEMLDKLVAWTSLIKLEGAGADRAIWTWLNPKKSQIFPEYPLLRAGLAGGECVCVWGGCCCQCEITLSTAFPKDIFSFQIWCLLWATVGLTQ